MVSAITNFPRKDNNKPVCLQNSRFPLFDLAFALKLKRDHPRLWSLGGNVLGNEQFALLSRIVRQGGYPRNEEQEKAIRLREGWAARHHRDFRPPGVVAQIKWLAVGEQGERAMKRVLLSAAR